MTGARGTNGSILTAESPDAARELFGRSIYSDNQYMMLLQLMFLNATEVWVYIAGGGTKATGTITTAGGTANVTAKYEGTLGNQIKIVSVANPLGGFDVSVVLEGSEVELFEGRDYGCRSGRFRLYRRGRGRKPHRFCVCDH